MNGADMIVIGLIICAISAVVLHMRRQKKAGTCCSGCSACSYASSCKKLSSK